MRFIKKYITTAAVVSLSLVPDSAVYGAALDYDTVLEAAEEEDKTVQTFETDDGAGNTVKIAAQKDTLYVNSKNAGIYAAPGEGSEKLSDVVLGDEIDRVGVCDNGWSKVSMEKDGEKINGYIQNQYLSDEIQLEPVGETIEVTADSDVLDYPSRKDGESIGEVLELDEVEVTGKVDDVWSQIIYTDNGEDQVGYIPNICLDLEEETDSADDGIDREKDAGTLHESEGKGVFADAVEDAAPTVTEENGVQVGTPVAASSDDSLTSLGTFKITHYCQCSICCGPYANGITSTGVTATTNHTIAVSPAQIPYGSKVVINGQVYVAEDCGGAIKTNCIDIYVASHAEALQKGVYYTEVYLLNE